MVEQNKIHSKNVHSTKTWYKYITNLFKLSNLSKNTNQIYQKCEIIWNAILTHFPCSENSEKKIETRHGCQPSSPVHFQPIAPAVFPRKIVKETNKFLHFFSNFWTHFSTYFCIFCKIICIVNIRPNLVHYKYIAFYASNSLFKL